MPVTPRKPWTVLIYMVADDPQGGELLDQQAVREMDEITKATLSVDRDQLHVALQVDFRSLPGVWRRVIGESTFVRPEGDAAHPATLYGFFEWAAHTCPADRYLLIFWGHSRGHFGLFGDPDPWAYTAQTLTLDELRMAIMAAKRSLGKALDVIAFKDCYMATLETAYELSGLADYLLASPSLVPIEKWPYEEMFRVLAADKKRTRATAEALLAALRKHYQDKDHRHPFPEVPYSLLSTQGAATVVGKLAALIGTDRTSAVPRNEESFRALLGKAATRSGDPALVDLGTLALGEPKKLIGRSASKDQKADFTNNFREFAIALGNAAHRPAAPGAEKGPFDPAVAPEREGLVIDHTGTDVGGVGAFVYPSSPKGVRESRLSRLADEKAYRRLAISTDTNWADIALRSMPLQPTRTSPEVSTAIGLLEQLERLGLGMGFGLAASSNAYYRSLAQRSRNGELTDADMAQATEFAAIAEIATRLAAFAAKKGGDGFAKGGDGFAKGGDGFAKGGDGFAKGGDGFAKGGDGFLFGP